jgi:hypothetical protein
MDLTSGPWRPKAVAFEDDSVGAMAKPVLADPRSLFGKASVHSGISRIAVGHKFGGGII